MIVSSRKGDDSCLDNREGQDKICVTISSSVGQWNIYINYQYWHIKHDKIIMLPFPNAFCNLQKMGVTKISHFVKTSSHEMNSVIH